MPKTAMIRARTEPGLKEDVELILDKLGLTTSEAINIFFNQIKLKKGIPFKVNLPNKTTLKTFNKTNLGKELNSYKNLDEFFKKIEK